MMFSIILIPVFMVFILALVLGSITTGSSIFKILLVIALLVPTIIAAMYNLIAVYEPNKQNSDRVRDVVMSGSHLLAFLMSIFAVVKYHLFFLVVLFLL